MVSFRPLVTSLEDRTTPAITFQFDYSMDRSGFFQNPDARASLEHAGRDLAFRIGNTPSAITPGGGNSWEASFRDPATGNNTSKTNLNIPAGTLLVFVGARNLGGAIGLGGPGVGFPEAGNAAFRTAVQTRGQNGFSPWGGSIAFERSTDWSFRFADGPGDQTDFYSTAVHELGHLVGFGTAPQFERLVQNGSFTGSNVVAQKGGPVQLDPESRSHFGQGTRSGDNPVSMQPTAEYGRRVFFSELDYAVLADIGWQINGFTGTNTNSTNGTALPDNYLDQLNGIDLSAYGIDADDLEGIDELLKQLKDPDGQIPALSTSKPADQLVAFSSSTGEVAIYEANDGELSLLDDSFAPFPLSKSPVRILTADFNGDKIGDFVFASGPGSGSHIRIVDGRDFQNLIPSFDVFEKSFTGGLFLAAGDLDGDGHDELIVSPDQGGGPRVKIFSFSTGVPLQLADFFGIEDPNFRGGARVTVGDLNGDGFPELVVAAGFGGGPRVAVFNGKNLFGKTRDRLIPDFFAFEPELRNGVYAAAGDTNGDGKFDLVLGAGPGGGPRVLTLNGQTLSVAGSSKALSNPLDDTFAGDTEERGGVPVTVKDLDADGKADIVAGSGTTISSQIFPGSKTGPGKAKEFEPEFFMDAEGVFVG